MYLGTQYEPRDLTPDYYQHLVQLGCNHVCSTPSGHPATWTAKSLTAHREKIEAYDLVLDMIPLGHIGIGQGDPWRAIMLGTDDRDQALDSVCDAIRHTAAAGIPAMKYYLHYLGVVSTGHVPGRGGSQNRTFVYADAAQEPLTEAGPIDADTMWERIACFLERVIPVAAEYKIRLACHPHDPPVPRPRGLRGIDRVMGDVNGLKRFIEIAENPYHGLNFCQGTICEMLEDPNAEICDIIRYFGQRDKIFNVHFRNIRGGFCDFVETFPDEGDVDMYEALRAYKEVDYQYMVMPDHVPKIAGPNPDLVAFGFALGYQKALMQAIDHLD